MNRKIPLNSNAKKSRPPPSKKEEPPAKKQRGIDMSKVPASLVQEGFEKVEGEPLIQFILQNYQESHVDSHPIRASKPF